ncbi:Two-component system response regulator OmpR [Cronobacter malonaticus 681]|nr:Two-component system response regulator OmpR [Cronobacter malonaticus 681]
MFREDEPMPLTSGEFAVLKALVSHPREPLSRDKLMNLARGREYSVLERSIDVQISRLRRMVEERSGASALYPDRLGPGLRLCAGRR